MSSADFPDGSRDNPAIIPDTDANEESSPSNFSNGSPDNPAIIPESDSDDEEAPPPPWPMSLLHEAVKMILDQEEEQNRQLAMIAEREEEEKRMRRDEERRRLNEESAERYRIRLIKSAKKHALGLHSDLTPNIVQENVEDEEEGKSKFQDAKRVIKNRRDSISTDIELNVMTKQRTAPKLTDLCVRALAQNSESIKSLSLVPDHLKKKLSDLVSDSRRLDKRFMQLLIQDSPSEVYARNCVDLEEKDLTHILCECDTASLQVLNLGLCGRAMTENTITEFLKRSPKGFPSLTKLSLQGAFCLTDNAVALISTSAPLLRFINLSDCSLLTSQAVKILADCFGSTLIGLNIGGCQRIKPSNIFRSSLSKFEKLNYLSVAGLESIHDVLVEFFTSCGSSLTDLSLASCEGLNDGTIWTLGRCCPNLEALDISELDTLTDRSLKEITDGCRSLSAVKFTKNRFSDVAVAAFLEVCGGSLNQLSLNNIRDVGQDTVVSLAKNCKMLHYLDLSWCRKLTEEDLRRILCSCWLLRSLKLFGWTQVKDEFVEELSRSKFHIVGLKMTSLFAHPKDSYTSIDAKFF